MGRKQWPAGILKFGLLVLVFALVGVGGAQADPIPTTCSGGSDCNGATYAVVVTSVDANTLNVKFVIDVDGYDGNATDFVKAVAFSIDGVGTYDNLDLLSAPGGASNWLESVAELNNKGGSGGCEGGGDNNACAQATSSFNGGKGIPISSADSDGQLIWEFQFDIGDKDEVGDTAHIKYLYVDTDDKKVGSLGSFDTATSSGTPGSPGGTPGSPGGTPGSPGGTPGTPVPEPGTLTLLGCGLIGIANLFRKQVKK